MFIRRKKSRKRNSLGTKMQQAARKVNEAHRAGGQITQ